MIDAANQCPVVPLCVDLDGTLTRADTTWELLTDYVLKSPLNFFYALWWLVHGRAELKVQLWKKSRFDLGRLPRDAQVRKWLMQQPAQREVLLVSGAPQELVDAFIANDSRFVAGIGSTAFVNLTRSRKAAVLVNKFGERGFDYLGNSDDDLAVWKHSRSAFGVQISTGLARRAASIGVSLNIVSRRDNRVLAAFRELRPKQWVKNVLCTVPLLASHRWGEILLLGEALGVFVALCISSSMIYIINDLRDLQADRIHPAKRDRPLASGELSLASAWCMVLALGCMWLISMLSFERSTQWLMAVQVAASLAYSFKIKSIAVLDIILLGLLYCNRIIIGGSALFISPTAWLIAFALFFFIGIACVKRHGEITLAGIASMTELPGRGYRASDGEMIRQMGYGSSLMSVLVLSLYITQPEIGRLYPTSASLWLLCVLVFYWVTRLWIKANRGETGDDPLAFFLSDKVSYFCMVIAAALVLTGSVAWKPIARNDIEARSDLSMGAPK